MRLWNGASGHYRRRHRHHCHHCRRRHLPLQKTRRLRRRSPQMARMLTEEMKALSRTRVLPIGRRRIRQFARQSLEGSEDGLIVDAKGRAVDSSRRTGQEDTEMSHLFSHGLFLCVTASS